MIDCDCSCNDYDAPSCVREVIRRARRPHTCCECGDTIEPGQRYEYVSGVWDGHPDWHHTCLVCVAIREHYCPHGWLIGGLAEQIEECLGFDYREVPDEEDDE
jgi:hypothetical protein